MKIISNEEYRYLKAQANKTDDKNIDLVVAELERKHKIEIEELTREHVYELEDKENELSRRHTEEDVMLAKQTKVLTDKITTMTIENGALKKENEILTSAFKNLGFDVKDMKDMLNKLVDGIVSKNQIQLVKSS